MNNAQALARLCQQQRRFGEARDYFERALVLARELSGEDSFDVAFVLSEIGELFFQKRELGRAGDEFLMSLVTFRKLSRLTDQRKTRMAFVLSRLALIREEQRKDEEAVRLGLESLDLSSRSAEPRANQDRLRFCEELALKLVNRRSYAAALPLWERAVALCRGGPPEVRRSLPVALWHLALTRLASAEPDRYMAIAAEVLRQYARDGGPDHDVFVARLVALTGADPAACAPYLKAREKGLRDGTAAASEYRLAGAVAFRRKDYREAVRLLEQSETKSTVEGTSPESAYGRLFLAMALHKLGEKKRAAENLREALRWLDSLDQNGGVNPATGQQLAWDYRMELSLLRREASGSSTSDEPGSLMLHDQPRPPLRGCGGGVDASPAHRQRKTVTPPGISLTGEFRWTGMVGGKARQRAQSSKLRRACALEEHVRRTEHLSGAGGRSL